MKCRGRVRLTVIGVVRFGWRSEWPAWGVLRPHRGLASGSAGSMPGISKSKFMSVNCPAPPLPLQQNFSDLVERLERLRAVQREALRQAEHLFASLLNRAFGG